MSSLKQEANRHEHTWSSHTHIPVLTHTHMNRHGTGVPYRGQASHSLKRVDTNTQTHTKTNKWKAHAHSYIDTHIADALLQYTWMLTWTDISTQSRRQLRHANSNKAHSLYTHTHTHTHIFTHAWKTNLCTNEKSKPPANPLCVTSNTSFNTSLSTFRNLREMWKLGDREEVLALL